MHVFGAKLCSYLSLIFSREACVSQKVCFLIFVVRVIYTKPARSTALSFVWKYRFLWWETCHGALELKYHLAPLWNAQLFRLEMKQNSHLHPEGFQMPPNSTHLSRLIFSFYWKLNLYSVPFGGKFSPVFPLQMESASLTETSGNFDVLESKWNNNFQDQKDRR